MLGHVSISVNKLKQIFPIFISWTRDILSNFPLISLPQYIGKLPFIEIVISTMKT